jgi:hypothetical protein
LGNLVGEDNQKAANGILAQARALLIAEQLFKDAQVNRRQNW